MSRFGQTNEGLRPSKKIERRTSFARNDRTFVQVCDFVRNPIERVVVGVERVFHCKPGRGDGALLRARRSLAAPVARFLEQLKAYRVASRPTECGMVSQCRKVPWFESWQGAQGDKARGGGELLTRGSLGAEHRPAEHCVVAFRCVIVSLLRLLVSYHQVEDCA